VPIIVDVSHAITFDQVSKEFIGTSAEVPMTIVNRSPESYSLRTGTRVSNQAGMVFRLQEPVNIAPGEEVTVRTVADDKDLYGEIIGERGNVPEGVRWEFPGLAPSERALIYAENRIAAQGGDTAYRTVLHEEDLEVARLRLEQELLAMAKQLVEEQRLLLNAERPEHSLEILYYDELTKTEFRDFVLPRQFLGEPVTSVPVEGRLVYTTYAYDAQQVLDMLSRELVSHVQDGKRLLLSTLQMNRLVTHVIDYSDDLSWIKLTVDLSGTEEYVLDPLSPSGAVFGKRVREVVAGQTKDTAIRILKNLPEVERVEISLWPPWQRTLPRIPSQITVTAVQGR
jgi:hypothetical protein